MRRMIRCLQRRALPWEAAPSRPDGPRTESASDQTLRGNWLRRTAALQALRWPIEQRWRRRGRPRRRGLARRGSIQSWLRCFRPAKQRPHIGAGLNGHIDARPVPSPCAKVHGRAKFGAVEATHWRTHALLTRRATCRTVAGGSGHTRAMSLKREGLPSAATSARMYLRAILRIPYASSASCDTHTATALTTGGEGLFG